MKKSLVIILSILMLSSCTAYKAKQIQYFDEECGIKSKKYVFAEDQIPLLSKGRKCENEECLKLFLSSVIGKVFVGPISTIISGTVVVTGNTIYWLEKTAKCQNTNSTD